MTLTLDPDTIFLKYVMQRLENKHQVSTSIMYVLSVDALSQSLLLYLGCNQIRGARLCEPHQWEPISGVQLVQVIRHHM